MAGAKVNYLKSVRFLTVGNDSEPVVTPDLILGGLFRLFDLGLKVALPVVSSSLVGLRLRAGGGFGASRVIEGR
jgi:hypothetical protein